MAYYLTRRQVEKHRDLLNQIRNAIDENKDVHIKPSANQTIGGCKYWIRNLLKCASQYPDFGYGDIANEIVVETMVGGSLVLKPSLRSSRVAPEIAIFDELAAMGEIISSAGNDLELEFTPSEDFHEGGMYDACYELGWKLVTIAKHGSVCTIKLVREEATVSTFDVIKGEE